MKNLKTFFIHSILSLHQASNTLAIDIKQLKNELAQNSVDEIASYLVCMLVMSKIDEHYQPPFKNSGPEHIGIMNQMNHDTGIHHSHDQLADRLSGIILHEDSRLLQVKFIVDCIAIDEETDSPYGSIIVYWESEFDQSTWIFNITKQ